MHLYINSVENIYKKQKGAEPSLNTEFPNLLGSVGENVIQEHMHKFGFFLEASLLIQKFYLWKSLHIWILPSILTLWPPCPAHKLRSLPMRKRKKKESKVNKGRKWSSSSSGKAYLENALWKPLAACCAQDSKHICSNSDFIILARTN